MTSLRNTRDAIFTIEFPDGRTYTGAAMAVEISVDRPVGEVFLSSDDISTLRPGPRTWEIELRGIGPLTVFDDLREAIGPAEMGVDWTCPYCGRNWPPSQHKCWDGANGCGANRPAMWWVESDGAGIY